MSDTPTPTPPSPEPPPTTSGKNAPRQRQVRGVAPEFKEFAKNQAQYITSVSGNPNMFIYTGADLVDRTGVVRRKQYDVTEAYTELVKLGDKRGAILNRLYQLGAYGNQKPSQGGLSDRDVNAMADLLQTANGYGYTFDVALDLATAEFGKTKTGGGVRFRPTPKQDLRTVFRNVSQQVLGRNLSDDEADRFARAYQSMERTEAYGGQRAPSAQVVAQQTVEQAAPEETAAMGALRLADAFDSFVKGMD